MVTFGALLLLLSLQIADSNGEYATPSPIISCICGNYTAVNSTWINSKDYGCKYCQAPCNDNICECLSEPTCEALFTFGSPMKNATLIVVGVNAMICLCCIGGIVWCVCSGLFCIQTASSPREKLNDQEEDDSTMVVTSQQQQAREVDVFL